MQRNRHFWVANSKRMAGYKNSLQLRYKWGHRSKSARGQDDWPQSDLTWDLWITWLASSWIGKFTPNSDANEVIGERVPEVKMIDLTSLPKSENAYWRNIKENMFGCMDILFLHTSKASWYNTHIEIVNIYFHIFITKFKLSLSFSSKYHFTLMFNAATKETLDNFSLIAIFFFQKSWDIYIIRSVFLCSGCMQKLTCRFNL